MNIVFIEMKRAVEAAAGGGASLLIFIFCKIIWFDNTVRIFPLINNCILNLYYTFIKNQNNFTNNQHN